MNKILPLFLLLIIQSIGSAQNASSAYPVYKNHLKVTSPSHIEILDIETDPNDGSYYIMGEFIDEIWFDQNTQLESNTIGAGKLKIFLAKYSANHNFLWHKYFESNGDAFAKDIIVDTTNSDVYITGAFKDWVYTDKGEDYTGTSNGDPNEKQYSAHPSQLDYFLNRIQSNGTLIWSDGGTDQKGLIQDNTSIKTLEKLVMNTDGTLYSVGFYQGYNLIIGDSLTAPSSSNKDLFMLEMDPSQNNQFTRENFKIFGGTGIVNIGDIIVDNAQQPIVVGDFTKILRSHPINPIPAQNDTLISFSANTSDAFLVKLSKDLQQVEAFFNYGSSDNDGINDIVLDTVRNTLMAVGFHENQIQGPIITNLLHSSPGSGTKDIHYFSFELNNLSSISQPNVQSYSQLAIDLGNGSNEYVHQIVLDTAGNPIIIGQLEDSVNFTLNAGLGNQLQGIGKEQYFMLGLVPNGASGYEYSWSSLLGQVNAATSHPRISISTFQKDKLIITQNNLDSIDLDPSATDYIALDTAGYITEYDFTDLCFNAVQNVAQLSHADSSDASLVLDFNGGLDRFNFGIIDINGPASVLDTANLEAGQYAVAISDATGCSYNDTITICGWTLDSISYDQSVLCFGDSNGTGALHINNHQNSGFNIDWIVLDTAGNGVSVNNLYAANYQISIMDSTLECMDDTTITITQPNQMISSSTSTNESISGYNDGIATIASVGGTVVNEYGFLWSTGSNNDTITNLTPGTYYVTITDDNNCITYDSVFIDTGYICTLNIDSIEIENESQKNQNDGSIALYISNPTSYNIVWNNGSTNAQIDSLTPGIYIVNLTDSIGCIVADTFVIDTGCFIGGSISNTSQSNLGILDGTALITLAHGSAPFQYLWSTGDTTPSIDSLGYGLYFVTVLDNKGCPFTASTNIETSGCSLVLNESITNVTGNGNNDGSISISVYNGFSIYNYQWSNGSNSDSLTNLSPGTYSVTVTDSLGCTVIDSFILNPFNCNFNSQLLIQDVTTLNSFDGGIHPILSGGTAPYNYNWSNGSNDSLLIGLSVGQYAVTITDSMGCSTIANGIIDIQGCSLNVDYDITFISHPGAMDGGIVPNVSSNNGPVTYHWSNGVSIAPNVGIGFGIYIIEITDSVGCQSVDTIPVGICGLEINFSSSDQSAIGIDDGWIQVWDLDAYGSVDYSWSHTPTNSGYLDNLPPGNYIVTISDMYNCIATDSVTIDAAVGISELNESGLLIFPNPATDFIHITNLIDVSEINILNSLGAHVRHIQLSNGDLNKTINLNGLPKGNYFIMMSYPDKNVLRRIEIN